MRLVVWAGLQVLAAVAMRAGVELDYRLGARTLLPSTSATFLGALIATQAVVWTAATPVWIRGLCGTGSLGLSVAAWLFVVWIGTLGGTRGH